MLSSMLVAFVLLPQEVRADGGVSRRKACRVMFPGDYRSDRRDRKECRRTARSGRVVLACGTVLDDRDNILDCIGGDPSMAKIQACSDAFYSEKLRAMCTRMARVTPRAVKKCDRLNRRHGSSFSVVECLRSNRSTKMERIADAVEDFVEDMRDRADRRDRARTKAQRRAKRTVVDVIRDLRRDARNHARRGGR